MKIRKAVQYLMDGRAIRRRGWAPDERLILYTWSTPMKVGRPADGWIEWAPSPLDLTADDWELAE